jgi:hypothetical protein
LRKVAFASNRFPERIRKAFWQRSDDAQLGCAWWFQAGVEVSKSAATHYMGGSVLKKTARCIAISDVAQAAA